MTAKTAERMMHVTMQLPAAKVAAIDEFGELLVPGSDSRAASIRTLIDIALASKAKQIAKARAAKLGSGSAKG